LGIVVSNDTAVLNNLLMLPTGIDALDARLIRALCDIPRAGVMELARQLGVARGTVQARLDKLQQRGIISGFDPDLDLTAMGYEVLAFVSLEIAQGRLFDVATHLREIPEVLEIHSVTGGGDLLCRVVARTNDHLQHVISRILEVHGINRTSTQIALTEQLRHRVLPLVELVIDHEDENPTLAEEGLEELPAS
jgi:DNA-binding Lrp family transcriptional regulator